VVSAEQVLRCTLDGDPAGVLVAKGTLQAPNAICVNGEGLVLVGDSGRFDADPEYEGGSRQVYAFDAGGTFLRKLGKAGGAPRGATPCPSPIAGRRTWFLATATAAVRSRMKTGRRCSPGRSSATEPKAVSARSRVATTRSATRERSISTRRTRPRSWWPWSFR